MRFMMHALSTPRRPAMNAPPCCRPHCYGSRAAPSSSPAAPPLNAARSVRNRRFCSPSPSPLAGRASTPPRSALRAESNALEPSHTVPGSDVSEGLMEEVVAPAADAEPPSTDTKTTSNPLLEPSSLRPMIAAVATLMVIGLDALDGPGHASVALGGLTAYLALLPDSGKAALREEGMLGPVVLVASTLGAAINAVQKGTDPATKTIREVSHTVSPLLPKESPKQRLTDEVEAVEPMMSETEAEGKSDVISVATASQPTPPAPPTHSSAMLPPSVTAVMATSLAEGRGKVLVSNGPGLNKAVAAVEAGEKQQKKKESAKSGLVAGIITLGLSAFGLAIWLIRGKGAYITEALPGGLCTVASLLMILAALLLMRRPPSSGKLGWAA